MNEAILVREGIIKWHFANTYDHQNSDVGAANRKGYKDGYSSSPENMFSTENYLNGNYIVHTGKRELNKKVNPLEILKVVIPLIMEQNFLQKIVWEEVFQEILISFKITILFMQLVLDLL